MFNVYVLRLKDGSIYIGLTANLDKRLRVHFHGGGAQATRKFGVDRVEKIIPVMSEAEGKALEKQLVIQYQENSGVPCVYGAGYTNTKTPFRATRG